MPPLSFTEARSLVLRKFTTAMRAENVSLDKAHGRVLAQNVAADRDYPPFNRSARDGFAVQAKDLPGILHLMGEVRAGEVFAGVVGPGECIEIMTGAPVPSGADAVVMVEHCTREGPNISCDRAIKAGANIVPRGSEATNGTPVLAAGTRIDYTAVAWLATVGHSAVSVYRKPSIAILATGDEIVGIEQQPEPHQIRNSNAWSLAAQVERAGGVSVILPIACDERSAIRTLIEQGLESDLLLLSGGVSAGKYDFVEAALAELDAEFFFDKVLIQPGQPVVFGQARGKFFFGLPGNPVSTMVTFEIFARAAIDLISGCTEAPLPMTLARLTKPFRHRPGLTRFLPANVRCTEITPVDWQGSGDVASLCRANAYLVADANTPEYAKGDLIPVMNK